jgi:hypothetical protein
MKERHFLGFDKGSQSWLIGSFKPGDRVDGAVRCLRGAETLAKNDFGCVLNKNFEYEIILDSNNQPIELLVYPNGRLDRATSFYEKKDASQSNKEAVVNSI